MDVGYEEKRAKPDPKDSGHSTWLDDRTNCWEGANELKEIPGSTNALASWGKKLINTTLHLEKVRGNKKEK